MDKIDARKLPCEALDEIRRQAMRQELKLSWKEIALVVGVCFKKAAGFMEFLVKTPDRVLAVLVYFKHSTVQYAA